jgi:hypothetical protein
VPKTWLLGGGEFFKRIESSACRTPHSNPLATVFGGEYSSQKSTEIVLNPRDFILSRHGSSNVMATRSKNGFRTQKNRPLATALAVSNQDTASVQSLGIVLENGTWDIIMMSLVG